MSLFFDLDEELDSQWDVDGSTSTGDTKASDANTNAYNASGEQKSSEDLEREAKLGKIGFVASSVGNIVGANNQKNEYSMSTYDTPALRGAMNANPWSSAFAAISDMGSQVGEAVSGDADEYGLYKNENKGTVGKGISGAFKPISSFKENRAQQEYLTDEEKSQPYNSGFGNFMLNLSGFGGLANAKNQKAIGERYKESDDVYKERQDAVEASNKRIQTSKDRFRRSAMSSGYGVMVARLGGLFGKEKMYLSIKEPTIEPYKRESLFKLDITKPCKTIKGLQKGGSVIPEGAYHHTSNNLGDKGLPVVDDNGVKIFEIETKELMLDHNVSDNIDTLRQEYNKTKDTALLKGIAKLMEEELIKNTYAHNPEYSCLNNNSCSLKQ